MMTKNSHRFIMSLTLAVAGACLLVNSIIHLVNGVETWNWMFINATFFCLNVVYSVIGYRRWQLELRQTLIQTTIGK